MKKVILGLIVAGSFAACNTEVKTEENKVDTVAVVDATPATTTVVYAESEGDVKMVNNKVMVYTNGAWTEAKKDVTLDNGVIVTSKGEVKKDGKVITIKEGAIVTKTGQFFDNTGKVIENAWDATVDATKNAANATVDATKNAANATADAANKAVENTKEGLKKAGDKIDRAVEELKK